jgi:GNAT superfamily N-acetyltransferase
MNVIPGRDAVDVGMVVAKPFRRQGFGAYIIRHAKAHVLTRGLRPVCGCAFENRASRKTLERAGFVCSHCMMAFSC